MTPLPTCLREALLDAFAVLSPVECAGCGADDRALCENCRRSLLAHPEVHTLAGPPELVLVTALRYERVVRKTIIALKEGGRTDVVRPLGSALGAALGAALAYDLSETTARSLSGALVGALSDDGRSSLELATIPTSRTAFRRRGYDPVRLLLRWAGFPRGSPVLARSRSVRQQKTLDREARGSNVAASLCARHPLDGRRFFIVDDVITTGSTVLEAARAIRAAGGVVVAAVAVAHTPLRTVMRAERDAS